MKNWFNTLSQRERLLVSFGSLAVILALLWLLVVNPLYKKNSRLNKQIDQQQASLITMRKQRDQIRELQQAENAIPVTNSNQNPQQLIERSLQTWRLKNALERMQSQGVNNVRLNLKNANADRVMRFLHELESQHALAIGNLSINRSNKESGFADFRLTMTKEDNK